MFGSKSIELQQLYMETLLAGGALETITSNALPDRFTHEGTTQSRNLLVVGMQTKLRDLADRKLFAQTLQAHHFKIIHLARTNVLKKALSGMNSRLIHQRFGGYNATSAEHIPSPIHVAPEILNDSIHRASAAEQRVADFVNSLSLPTLKVSYEEMLENEPGVFWQILEFLGLEVMPLQSKILKSTADDLTCAIQNYHKIVERFRGTEYEKYLTSDSVGHAGKS